MLKFYEKLLIFIVLMFFIFSKVVWAEETIRLTNGEWLPFSSEKYKYYGVFSHIVSKAFSLEGIQVKYKYFPWKRCYELAKRDIFDGSVIWQKKPEREIYFYFSDNVLSHRFVFFHRKDFDFNWESVSDLAGLNIGVTIGYDYENQFKKAAKEGKFNLHYVPSDEINFRKLINNRIQLFPHDINVGKAILNTHFSQYDRDKITYHPKLLINAKMRLMLNKKNQNNIERMKKFNRGLKKLYNQGIVELYLKKLEEGYYQENFRYK
ncbi:substrate-binding periplasmic protein [Spartinivicinus ruber]|uniref:substrate-binding periplasmic protein n=1 Tax=Spartinivicinus ruber TaxID=2683272 RepID=UPI0013D7803E|nr:ABC transporter substrate-binding protein [Spartinivicinus ruber]